MLSKEIIVYTIRMIATSRVPTNTEIKQDKNGERSGGNLELVGGGGGGGMVKDGVT